MRTLRSEIIYEDETLVVINKAPGDLSIPDRHRPELFNLQNWLEDRYGQIWVVHRLDRETSGVLCFARSAEAHRQLSMQFENREVKKTYLALVDGTPFPPAGDIDQPIAPNPSQPGKMMVGKKGKSALTHYQVTETFRQFSLLEVDIQTGRTHQIRVHLAHIGNPLAVDQLYGKRNFCLLSEIKGQHFRLGKEQEERPLMSRHTLHAVRLQFHHPSSGKIREFSAPLQKDFSAMLKQLRKWGK